MRYLRSEIAAQDGKTGLWGTEGAALAQGGEKVPKEGRFSEECAVMEEIVCSTACGGALGVAVAQGRHDPLPQRMPEAPPRDRVVATIRPQHRVRGDLEQVRLQVRSKR